MTFEILNWPLLLAVTVTFFFPELEPGRPLVRCSGHYRVRDFNLTDLSRTLLALLVLILLAPRLWPL